MTVLLNLTVSVAAGIISHYICKWLDRYLHDN